MAPRRLPKRALTCIGNRRNGFQPKSQAETGGNRGRVSIQDRSAVGFGGCEWVGQGCGSFRQPCLPCRRDQKDAKEGIWNGQFFAALTRPILRTREGCIRTFLEPARALERNSRRVRGRREEPVTISAGPDWISLEASLDIESGSALDFSPFLRDQPLLRGALHVPRRSGPARRAAGAPRLQCSPHPSLRARPGPAPGTHPPTQSRAARAVRLPHGRPHPTRYLSDDRPLRLPQRPVPRDRGMDRDGNVPMDTFKILVPVHDGAWENWKTLSRAFLRPVAFLPASTRPSIRIPAQFHEPSKNIRPSYIHRYGELSLLANCSVQSFDLWWKANFTRL